MVHAEIASVSPLPPVVFEDASLLVFAKPAGLPVVPDPFDRARGSLMETVAARYGAGLVNVLRLDTAASGLVVVARTKSAQDLLSGQFQAKTAENYFEALVVGAPTEENSTIELVLKADEADPRKMCVVKKHGQAAATEVRVLARYGRFTHVECRALTGRKHQVRVHLAATGTPVLNDEIYGDGTRLLLSEFKRGYKGREEERPLITALALHAGRLAITHPGTRERLTLTAPRSKEFTVALKNLERFVGGRE